MNNFWVRLVVFLVLNFGALYVGNLLQGDGPFSEWYLGLNIAPWTPPGWFFGVAWTGIMICFSIYMSLLTEKVDWQKVIPIFAVQFILNVAWNPTFFRFHYVLPSLVVMLLLIVVVFLIGAKFRNHLGNSTLLLAPYGTWLLVAATLNAYVLLYN
jgi:tryptophan-rich sensory protein